MAHEIFVDEYYLESYDNRAAFRLGIDTQIQFWSQSDKYIFCREF